MRKIQCLHFSVLLHLLVSCLPKAHPLSRKARKLVLHKRVNGPTSIWYYIRKSIPVHTPIYEKVSLYPLDPEFTTTDYIWLAAICLL